MNNREAHFYLEELQRMMTQHRGIFSEEFVRANGMAIQALECNIISDVVPSAQPERKKGKWINHRNDDGHNIADCDQCGNAIQWFDGDEIPRYCCMCGADMRGE